MGVVIRSVCVVWLYQIQKWSFQHLEIVLDALNYGMP